MLKGKSAIVTGSTSGLGLGVARAAQEGITVERAKLDRVADKHPSQEVDGGWTAQ